MKRKTTTSQRLILLGLSAAMAAGLFVVVHPAQAAWSEPQTAPPGGNVAAPLNVGTFAQTKSGPLTIQGAVTTSGGILSTNGTGSSAIDATAPAATSAVTAGVVGKGATAAAESSSVGVYSISYTGTPGDGAHIGLLGVAGANTSNSFGVYGWSPNRPNAYAGYFRGQVAVVDDGPTNIGKLSATQFCLGGTCINSWSEVGSGGSGSLFTENPGNNTFLNNTNSNLALGGSDSTDAAFFFDVSANGGNGLFSTPGSVTIGLPSGAITGDSICQSGEACTAGNPDCWNKPANCTAGKVCAPDGSGCVSGDTTPPSVNVTAPANDATVSNSVLITTNAVDNVGIGKVEFFQDGTSLGYVVATPFNINWDSTTVANGAHTLNAIATDTSNNTTTSTSISVNVQNAPPGDTSVPTDATNFRWLDNTAPNWATRVYLEWTPAIDPQSGISTYHITRKAGNVACEAPFDYDNDTGPFFTLTSPDRREFINIGLTASTTYTFCLKAVNGASPQLESANYARYVVTTVASDPSGSGPPGSSPVILKVPCCVELKGEGRGPQSLPIAANTNITEPVASALLGGYRPLSRLLGIPAANAKIMGFSIPAAQAASPFGGNANVRLTIHNGVVQIRDSNGTTMEVGNGGTDVASTGSVILRPGNTTQAQGASFAKTGSATDLNLTGKLQATGDVCTSLGGGKCLSSVSVGGGAVSSADQVIWNSATSPPTTPLGTPPQPASLNIQGSAYVGTAVGVGTTAPNPSYKLDVNGRAGASDLTIGTNVLVTSNGSVGVGTASPSASYKLDVNGSAQIQTGSIHFTAASLQNCDTLDTSSGTIICGSDAGGAGGTVGTDGNGGANRVAYWTNNSTITGNPIYTVDATARRMTISSVTIGDYTATPGVIASRLFIGSGGTSPDVSQIAFGDGTGFKFHIGSMPTGNFTPKFTFVDSGKLGINQTSPVAQLEVGGNVHVTNTPTGAVGDLVVGGANNGDGDASAEICFGTQCISDWSDLILNTAKFGVAAQTGGFYITGDGRITQKLTVDQKLIVDTGPIQLPTTSRIPYGSEIRSGGIFNGYNISSQYRFGANNDASGLGFFEDDDNNVIAAITEDRKVHLGYAGNPTQLCLYGSGAQDCKSQWPSGGGGAVSSADQVIWNSATVPPTSPLGTPPQPASLNIQGSAFIGSAVGIGTTAPGSAKLAVINGNIGVGTTEPLEKLTVGGTSGNALAVEMNPPTNITAAVVTGGIPTNALPPGNHYFKVAATNGAETTLASSGDVLCVIPPVDGINRRCQISWTGVNNTGLYTVYRGTDSGGGVISYTHARTTASTILTYSYSSEPAGSLPAQGTFLAARIAEDSYFRGYNGFGTTTPQATLDAVNPRLEGNVYIPDGGVLSIGTQSPTAGAKFEINTNGVSQDRALMIKTGNDANYISVGLGRLTDDSQWAVASANGNFSSQATAGDTILRATNGDLILMAGQANAAVKLTTGPDFNSDVERLTVYNSGNVKVQGTNDLIIGGAKTDGDLAGSPEICLGASCVTSLSTGGVVTSADQVIWNSATTPPTTPLGTPPQPASLNIQGSAYVGTAVGIGTTAPGSAKLAVINGSVGIGNTSPATELGVTGRINVAPSGTTPDVGYNGNVVVTKPAASGQYINLVRSGNVAWSIGTAYNTNNFAIGTGIAADTSFTSPFLSILSPGGNVGIGNTGPTALLTVSTPATPFDTNHTFAAYNDGTNLSGYNAVSGFKSGSAARGSAVYGELVSSMTCAGTCAGVYASDGGTSGSGRYAGYFSGLVQIGRPTGGPALNISGNGTAGGTVVNLSGSTSGNGTILSVVQSGGASEKAADFSGKVEIDDLNIVNNLTQNGTTFRSGESDEIAVPGNYWGFMTRSLSQITFTSTENCHAFVKVMEGENSSFKGGRCDILNVAGCTGNRCLVGHIQGDLVGSTDGQLQCGYTCTGR